MLITLLECCHLVTKTNQKWNIQSDLFTTPLLVVLPYTSIQSDLLYAVIANTNTVYIIEYDVSTRHNKETVKSTVIKRSDCI